MEQIAQILQSGIQHGASDIMIVPNEPPMIRIHGSLRKLDMPPLNPAPCQELILAMLTPEQRLRFEAELSLDCSYSCGNYRFRMNVFRQNQGIACMLRVISDRIPTPEELGLPPSMVQMTELPRGLVLVTGPTGSGKSTTLASLIESINQKRHKHILTIEDPIEFVYTNKKSIVNQREIGVHARSFAQALRDCLRQNPDVILVGEMRDLETISLAVTAAETGHLCFATLHTQDAPSSVDRIINVFPAGQQQEIRTQLSVVLAGVVSQMLLPRKGGGRVCAREVMTMTSAVGSLIRDSKTPLLYSEVESGAKHGMMSFDQHLAALFKQELIELQDGLAKAHNADNFRTLIAMEAMRNADAQKSEQSQLADILHKKLW